MVIGSVVSQYVDYIPTRCRHADGAWNFCDTAGLRASLA